MELSGYSLVLLREDGEFILCRAHARRREQLSVLLLVPVAGRPGAETLEKPDRERSLRNEREYAWPAGPKVTSRRDSEIALNQHLSESIETRHALNVAAVFATAELPGTIVGTAPCWPADSGFEHKTSRGRIIS